MLYLGHDDVADIGTNWTELIDVIGTATTLYKKKDYAQPIKPYLRYGDLVNRIIAMPAFVGGDISVAGIKWIASFPGNIDRGLQRAHSVTILNEASTGKPLSLINTTMISAIRTAAVTASVINVIKQNTGTRRNMAVGISGFGPIGQIHLQMVTEVLKHHIDKVTVFDVREVESDVRQKFSHLPVQYSRQWQEAYDDADVFITCTVSKNRYIDRKPKAGSLQLNISLRDYMPEMLRYMKYVVVDSWDEICRENTDIEKMHLEQGLQKENTISLADFHARPPMVDFKDVVFFNPMGMAIYDIAVANYYFNQAQKRNIGIYLK